MTGRYDFLTTDDTDVTDGCFEIYEIQCHPWLRFWWRRETVG